MTSSRVAGGLRPTNPQKSALRPFQCLNFPSPFSLFSFLFFSCPGNPGNVYAMSAEILTQMFLGETQNPRLDEILWQKIAEAIASQPGLTPSGCLLTDMGNFLLRATSILSGLAKGMVSGQHIRTYTKEKVQEMREDHDFSELEALEYMDEKHKFLKFVTVDRQLSCSVLTS